MSIDAASAVVVVGWALPTTILAVEFEYAAWAMPTLQREPSMTISRCRQLIGFFCFLSFLCGSLMAENWPQFRGTSFDGIAKSNFPVSWSDSENVRWKVPINGEGWSCPIVWDDKVVVTAAVPTSDAKAATEPYQEGRRQRVDLTKMTYRWEVICLDGKTGDIAWRKVAREGNPPMQRHRDNSYATETPATDGERVYAYFGMTGIYCYDLNGNLQWEKDLGNYEMRAGWGTASSPVVFGDRVFLQIDNEEQSFVVALNSKTGEEIWRVDRDEPSQYSSPVIWENGQRTELVTGGTKCRSYELATGKLLWEVDLEKGRCSSTPLVDGDRLYVGTEFRDRGGPDDGGGNLFALSPTDSGVNVDWKVPKSGIQMASPILARDHIYLFERRSGTVHCINAKTGNKVFRARVPGARAFWASPWTYDGKVFTLDDAGTTHVIEAGDSLQVLRKNSIGERTWSSPAIANSALFLRTAEHLYCIAKAE